MAAPMEYRPLAAPANDGEELIDPAGEAISRSIETNVAARSGAAVLLGGRSLQDVAAQARVQLLRDAKEYVARYRSVSDSNASLSPDGRIYLTGHQPELFHPGVWLKNFVLDALAQRDGAAAVHVLIDNDQARAPAVRVPAGSTASPQLVEVPFDAPANACAWEEREVLDRDRFVRFGSRAAEAIAPLVAQPLVLDMWRHAEAALEVTSNLGECLAQLRHRLEAAWGLTTLEVPLSHLCRSESFCWFAAFLLAQADRVADVHNRTLAEYRRVHRLRSRSHPAPDLAEEGDWTEAPFWIWTAGDSQRRRLFVKRRRDAIVLTDRAEQSLELAAPSEQDIAGLANDLFSLTARGIKLRPRALITTMYLRVVLSDFFIHGIGGAKYDQATDRLIAELVGIAPPGFATVTGTRLLPIACPAVSDADIRRLDSRLRDLRFHPERFLDLRQAWTAAERQRLEGLTRRKQELLAREPPSGAGRARHAELSDVNAALAGYVSSQYEELLRQREELLAAQRSAAVLRSREFAFCLFPEAGLRTWLLDAAAGAI